MSLDFSVLDNIRGKATTAPGKHATGQNRAPEEIIPSHQLDKEKREREKLREIYHIQQENIRKADTLRSEILKGIQRAEEPTVLLLKAIKCISLMTGDTVIYTQSKRDISAVYGQELEEI